LIAGYWIWKLNSLQEAIEWVKECPNPTGATGEIEIRQIMEIEDVCANQSPRVLEEQRKLCERARNRVDTTTP
jgi:hypothetical protein